MHYVWDKTINGLRKNYTTAWVATNVCSVTKSIMFGATLSVDCGKMILQLPTDYGKMIPWHSAQCLGHNNQWIMEKWHHCLSGNKTFTATKCAIFGTKLWTDYGKIIPRQSVLFWDNTINRLWKNDSATKCAMFGTTLSMDYGKMFQRQSVLCLGQRYEQSTKKWFISKVCYVWDKKINWLRKNYKTAWVATNGSSSTKCIMFGATLLVYCGKMILQHYQGTMEKWFHDKVHNVWDKTINGLRNNDTTAWVATNTFTATKCAFFGTTLSTDYGKIIPRQSVLCLGHTINGLRKNDFATKCAMFWTTLSMDYGKIFERQSALCLGQHYQRITEKWFCNKVCYVWDKTINWLCKNYKTACVATNVSSATRCAMFGTRLPNGLQKNYTALPDIHNLNCIVKVFFIGYKSTWLWFQYFFRVLLELLCR